MDRYMVVISFDAVSSEDIEVLNKLPNFNKLISDGVLIKNVESVYPTLTYPAHATIISGNYPQKHRIVDNTKLEAGDKNPNWYWYRKDLQGDTLYDLAKRKGYTTCSLLWPVTGRSSITYNMPEIFAAKPYQNQIIMSAMAGSLKYQLDINKRFGHIRKGISQPELDDFVIEAAKYTIKSYAPNLTLIHFTDVDTHRHNCGYNCKNVTDALLRHDKRLGEIVDVLKEQGIYDKTTIVALGDHSALDVDKVIKLNKLFLDNGLIKVSGKGKIIDYKVICKSLDGSAYIYLKDNNDIDTKERVNSLLKERLDEFSEIEIILSGEEAMEIGADGNCSFMVEASRGYYFVDDIDGAYIEKIKEEDYGVVPHRYRATHGYSPKIENYNTFFIASGYGVNKGLVIDGGKLINHGPTMAKILGLEMKDVDGEVEERVILK